VREIVHDTEDGKSRIESKILPGESNQARVPLPTGSVNCPRDKAKVEVGVQIVERWIVAALRHRQFFRLEDLNRAIRELLATLVVCALLHHFPYPGLAPDNTRSNASIPHSLVSYGSIILLREKFDSKTQNQPVQDS